MRHLTLGIKKRVLLLIAMLFVYNLMIILCFNPKQKPLNQISLKNKNRIVYVSKLDKRKQAYREAVLTRSKQGVLRMKQQNMLLASNTQESKPVIEFDPINKRRIKLMHLAKSAINR